MEEQKIYQSQEERIQEQFELFLKEAKIMVPVCDTRVFLDSNKQHPLTRNIRTPLLNDFVTLTHPINPCMALASLNNALPQINLVYADFIDKRVFIVDYCRAVAKYKNGYCTEDGSYASAYNATGTIIETAGYRSAQTFRGINPELRWIEILGVVPEDALVEHARTFGRINSKLDEVFQIK